MTVIIKATDADLDSIFEIENSCFNVDGFNRRQLSYLINKANGIFYAIKSDGQTVGYISLLAHSKRKCLRIYSLAVHPEHRGKHLAEYLIEKAIHFAVQNRFELISLEVNISNYAAQKLYEKKKFSTVGVRKNYYSDGSDAYVMELKLPTC